MNSRFVYTSFFYYLPSYIFGIIALLSLNYRGTTFFILPIFSFVLIPTLELFLPQNNNQNVVKEHLFNRIVIWLIAPFHFYILIKYLIFISGGLYSAKEFIGSVSTVGILCGVYGINVAHELGHRKEKFLQITAQSLLMTSLYMHFFIEHNRGHHKKIGTPQDPATARINESLYQFLLRCIVDSFSSALALERTRLKRLNKSVYSADNQMIKFIIIQFILVITIPLVFNIKTMLFFITCSLVGIILLETINYIEHYGLLRKQLASGVYERVNETHSWNSDHLLGRYLLFELTRHSHHHENSSRPYEDLESMPASLQLPTGYPGMMLLSVFPPLFFKVMNPRITTP